MGEPDIHISHTIRGRRSQSELMSVTAWAPGSVTTVFVPRASEEGSLGVSFAIEDGVTVTVSPREQTWIALDGMETAFEPIAILLEDLELTAHVDIESSIPVGRGFGASGAATLATALASGELFDLDRSRAALLQAAHRAELAAETGQGDVFVQDRGGLVWNTGDGVGRRERTDPIAYSAFEGIPTAEVLTDQETLATVSRAGTRALADFDPEMPLEDWFATSREFAEATGLVTEQVSRAIERVQEDGGAATMAMVGETVIATGGSGALDHLTAITPKGARVEG